LPGPIADYVRQGAAALGCDPAYLALPALSSAASAIGNTREVALKRGWTEPSVVWSGIVGDSGTLKSPAYMKAVAHLFAIQKRLQLRFRQELDAWRRERRREKERGDGPPGAPEPTMKRVICSDTTVEKLAELLEDNPRGLLVARDELAGWLGSFSRYKGKAGGSDLPYWLEMHRAGAIMVDRKTGDRRSVFVSRAAVSVTGGIQPGALARALTPEFLDAGLAARLLLAMPPKLPKRWSEAEIDPEVQRRYEGLLDALLALDFETNSDGERVPRVLRLSADAKAAWVAFYNEWAAEQAAVEGEVAAAYSKLEAYAARLALLHHVATHVGPKASDLREIGISSVKAGIRLCRWFAGETRRIYATLSETGGERDARRLVEFIASRGRSITARDLQRSNNRKYPTAGAAEEALDALVQAGLGVWEEQGPTPRGGPPTRAFHLCTTHDTTPPAGEDGDQGSHETAADTTGRTPGNSSDPGGSVGSVMRRADAEGAGRPGGEGAGFCQPREDASGGSVAQGGPREEVEEAEIP
jgi:hypothetical protein